MNKRLKCVIFGDRDVIQNDSYLPNVEKLIDFLISRNIKPVILSNDAKPQRLLLKSKLKARYQQLDWYIADRDHNPKKPRANSVNFILDHFGFEANEAIYVGNTDIDMQTAVNGKLLFLNASWYGKKTDYGFEFQTPKEIAHFIDVFCLRDYLWAYHINEQGLEYYALGIYGTREEKYNYSIDARNAAKFGRGNPDFWIKYLLSTVYFSGLHERIDYIAPYPSHKEGTAFSVMEDPIITFAKCFRVRYLKNLIIRHSTATKSAFARSQGKSLDHLNQLNTIKLNPCPIKNINDMSVYARSPLKKGKTVLIIDDFCTQGYSLEAARAYIEHTGANVILISLLKTIIRNYSQIIEIDKIQPFEANINLNYQTHEYPFREHIVETTAHLEISSKLEEYQIWQW